MGVYDNRLMSLIKIGNGLIESDRVLAIRPRLDGPIKFVEAIYDNQQTVAVTDSDPEAAIQAYLAATGPAADRSTVDLSNGVMKSTSGA